MFKNTREVIYEIANLLRKTIEVMDELLKVLRLARILLRYFVWGFTVRPRGLGVLVQVKEEYDMGQVFTFQQLLLPVPQGVVSQRLSVTVDGVSQEPIVVGADATSLEFKAGPAGASVVRVLDYLDAAGNDSANFNAEPFVIVDGIAPAAPTGFGELTQIGEEFVEDAPVDPVDDAPVDTPDEDVPVDDPEDETLPE